MTKKCAFTILEDLNSAASRGCGVKDGHAADRHGMLRDVLMVFTEDNTRTDRSSSVSIMVKLILNQCTQIAFVASPT